jgi:hypothetical protein
MFQFAENSVKLLSLSNENGVTVEENSPHYLHMPFKRTIIHT